MKLLVNICSFKKFEDEFCNKIFGDLVVDVFHGRKIVLSVQVNVQSVFDAEEFSISVLKGFQD